MYVEVNGNLDRALKIFNRKVKQTGIIREIYDRKEYKKPSVMKKEKREEADRRRIRELKKNKKSKY